MSETGSDVTSRQSNHGFLLVCNTNFRSMAYRSQVICDFSLVNNGGLSISVARGRRKPEVASSSDRVTMVSYKCPTHVLGLLCTVHESYASFF
jgi:hypothetical protein